MKQTRKRRILIVDDSKMNREILTGILEDEYDIVEAEDGKKAIAIMEEGLYSFSIVLLDITMPELDGFGVLQVMQQRNWLKELPVIAYASAKGGVINMTRQAAIEWATKGVTVNALCPGFFASEANGPEAMEAMNDFIETRSAMCRPGNPGELDSSIVYLAAKESSYVTAAILTCDGGWTAV